MLPKQLNALKKSIIHWEENLADPMNASSKEEDCALCQLHDFHCKREYSLCPVAEESGLTGCKETPWVEANELILKGEEADFKTLEHAIKEELDFLKSLLP